MTKICSHIQWKFKAEENYPQKIENPNIKNKMKP